MITKAPKVPRRRSTARDSQIRWLAQDIYVQLSTRAFDADPTNAIAVERTSFSRAADFALRAARAFFRQYGSTRATKRSRAKE